MDNNKNILQRFIDWFLNIFSVNDLKDDKQTPPKSKKKTEPNIETPIESNTKSDSLPKIEPKPTTPTDDKSGIPTKKPTTTTTPKTSGAITIDPDYSNRKGYNADFLSLQLPLPKLSKKMQAKIALTTEGRQKELKYHHYSVVMNGERKMPFLTAVNVDALSYEKLGDVPSRTEIGRDKWYLDPRIPKDKQLPVSFYDKNDFDIGHQVRREDTLWGDTLEFALQANNDTFHLTNAAPQHKDFNRNAKRWLGLENYALQNARKFGLKITVFTGPVFNDKDGVYNDIKIPDQFWKVIVMIKDDGTPSATGYMVQQNDLISDIVTRGFMYEQFLTYQVPISEIEDLTDIKFGLNDYDPIQKKKTRSLSYEFRPELVDTFDKIIF